MTSTLSTIDTSLIRRTLDQLSMTTSNDKKRKAGRDEENVEASMQLLESVGLAMLPQEGL